VLQVLLIVGRHQTSTKFILLWLSLSTIWNYHQYPWELFYTKIHWMQSVINCMKTHLWLNLTLV